MRVIENHRDSNKSSLVRATGNMKQLKSSEFFVATKPMVSNTPWNGHFFPKKNKVSLENVRRELFIEDYQMNLMLWPKSC